MAAQEFLINLKQDTSWQMHRLHFHDGIEIMLVLSDGGEIFFDKDVYSLHRYTLMVLDANTLHRTVQGPSDAIFERYVFHILPSLLERISTPRTNFAAMLRHCGVCVQLDDRQAKELIRLFEQLRVPEALAVFGWDVRQRISLMETLLLVCGAVRSNHAEEGVANPDYEKIQPILAYIQNHYTDQMSLDELAAHFMFSKHYLCHIFKKGTNFSVMEYVIQLRVIEAQRLLREGVSVQEAGERSGFQSYAHFIRTFNTYTGSPPKQYAKQFRQGDHFTL